MNSKDNKIHSSEENMEINSEYKVIRNNEDKLNRNLHFKVQNIIKNAKIQKYAKESNNICSEKISFFGSITGKNELQLERMRNIKLRIELLQSEKIEERNTYELKEIMADLYACAISELGGKFTTEMKNIYDKINTEYLKDKVSEKDIYKIACEKIVNDKNCLPMIHNEKIKGIFGDIKVQTKFYKLENQKLENQILLERGKSQFETFSYENKGVYTIVPINVKNSKKGLTNL